MHSAPPGPPLADLLARLLPPDVRWHSARLGAPVPPLHPAEAAGVAAAVPKRQHEFAAGRHCARLALRALGAVDGPILLGADRAPVWPAGVVGSISHNDDFCAAAVARTADVAGLGIDIDTVARFAPSYERTVCTAAEISRYLHGSAAAERQRRGALLFCIKEAFYKAQYTLTRGWLDFEDVEVARWHDLGQPLSHFELLLHRPPRARLDGDAASASAGLLHGRVLAGQCAVGGGCAVATVLLRPAGWVG